MRVLLDTHAFLWATTYPKKLPPKLSRYLQSSHERLVSTASLWEIAIKVRTGKLIMEEPRNQLVRAAADLKAVVLPIRANHVFRTLTLPGHHKDPFDRLLVAQAMEEGAALATDDDMMRRYAVDIFW